MPRPGDYGCHCTRPRVRGAAPPSPDTRVAEQWRDVAHIWHAELLTPPPEASLEYFTTLLGMTVVLEQHGSFWPASPRTEAGA
jgi:hypothetical protein